MMKSTVLAVLLSGLTASFASAQADAAPKDPSCPADPTLARALDSLQSLDPIRDAQAAAERSDYRFWAVQGYATQIPGVAEPQAIEKGSGYRVFEHTGDGIISLGCRTQDGQVALDSTHAMWNRAAYEYALAYNRELQRVR
jgi:hypothetical protein